VFWGENGINVKFDFLNWNQKFKNLDFSTFNRYKKNEKRTIENKNFLKKVNFQYYIFRNEKKAEKLKSEKNGWFLIFYFIGKSKNTKIMILYFQFEIKNRLARRYTDSDSTDVTSLFHFSNLCRKTEKWKNIKKLLFWYNLILSIL